MSSDREQPYDFEVHLTTSFTMPYLDISYDCPDGGEHSHHSFFPACAVAYCVCGWSLIQPYDPSVGNAEDIAGTLARMWSGEHLAQEQEAGES